MANITHTYEDVVEALQIYVNNEIVTNQAVGNRYILEDASSKRILLSRHYDDGHTSKIYLTTSIKKLVEYLNKNQKAAKNDIQKSFGEGPYNPNTEILRALCRNLRQIFKMSNEENWIISYRPIRVRKDERFVPSWDELMQNGLIVYMTDNQRYLPSKVLDILFRRVKSKLGYVLVWPETCQIGEFVTAEDYAEFCRKNNVDFEKPLAAILSNIFVIRAKKIIDKFYYHAEKSSSMLSEFTIKNYKGINELHLTGLRQINLFVGKNNVGKSNLLEAISLYVNNWSFNSLLQILGNRREKIDDFIKPTFNQSEKSLLENFSPILPYREISFLMRKNNNAIILGAKRNFTQLALMYAYYRRDSDTEANRLYQLSPFSSRTSKISSNSELVLATTRQDNDDSSARTISTDVSANTLNLIRFTKSGLDYTNYSKDEARACLYINCKSLSTELSQDLWADFSLTEKEEEILDALRLIDEQIEGFNFINTDGRIVPLVKIGRIVDGETKNIRIPISELGDSLVHVLNIIIAVLKCQNGVLLLDEVESGLHYSTQNKLWKSIFELAKNYNVQIFATTHSNDCIKAFAESGASSDEAMMARLSVKTGKVEPIYYRDLHDILLGLQYQIEGR